jgi:hypothetical protein
MNGRREVYFVKNTGMILLELVLIFVIPIWELTKKHSVDNNATRPDICCLVAEIDESQQ